MSRLILEGDLNSNFGVLMPIPYIDMVTIRDYISPEGIRGYEFNVEYSMLFTLPEHDPNLPTKELEIVRAILDKINISLMFTKSSADYLTKVPLVAGGDIEGTDVLRLRRQEAGLDRMKLEHMTGTKFGDLEDPLDELSLVKHDPSVLAELFIDQDTVKPGISYDIINITGEAFERNLASGLYTYLYDKKGRKFIKIKAATRHELTVHQTLTEGDFHGFTATMNLPVMNPTINLLAFTSMHTVDEIVDLNLKNHEQYTMFFSDIAYEEILREGKVKNQTSESFFDDNREVYPTTPFESLNGRYYKTDTTTHKDVYSKFNNLLDSYISILPDVPADVESADPELVGSVEVIQYALEIYKDKVDLLPQINKARKQIINRSSGTRSGALFSDMAKMLGRVDSVVQRATPLTKKLTINAKIQDHREMVIGDVALPIPKVLTDEIADDMIGFQYGRTILFTSDEYSTFDLSDFIDRSTFAGFDVGDGFIGPYGSPRSVYGTDFESPFTGKYDETIHRMTYNAAGQIVIEVVNPVDGSISEIVVPDYAGFFDETYPAKKEINQTNGFVTVDWQTLLIDHSVLSTMVDVRKFVQAFGLGPIKKYFIPHKAILKKNRPVYSGEGSYPLTPLDAEINRAQTYTDILSIIPYDGSTFDPAVMPVYSPGTEGPGVENNKIVYGAEVSIIESPEAFALEGKRLFSYMSERNVSFLPVLQNLDAATGADIESALASAGLDYTDLLTDQQEARLDHRLMYFEFQNFDSMATYMDYDKPVLDFYKFEFSILDYTKSALVDIIKHYYYVHFALKNYLDDAGQECSYNTVDGVFNDFFAEAMRAAFVANPGAAPWIFCPVVYIRHIDFLTNQYGGDQTRMLIAAREIIQKISPETGTLENLRAFYQNYIGLYTGYYAPGSRLGDALSLLGPHDDSEDDYAYHHGVLLEINSRWHHQVNYSAQNETERDQFLSLLNEKRYEYATISEAYRNQLEMAFFANEQKMRRLFEKREEMYKEKMEYEVSMCAVQPPGGGCYYCMWWDAWDSHIWLDDERGPPPLILHEAVRSSRDEFGYVTPDGMANNKYGYYWIGPYDTDQVFERYPIEKYGPPTEFACFPKDFESSELHPKTYKCRVIQNAYMLRTHAIGYSNPEDDPALDEDRNNKLTMVDPDTGAPRAYNTFGSWTRGQYIEVLGGDFTSYTWTRDFTTNADVRRQLLDPFSDADTRRLNEEENRFTVERKIPGFESIYNYKNFEDWKTQYRQSGQAGMRAGYSMSEYEKTISEFLFGHSRFQGIT